MTIRFSRAATGLSLGIGLLLSIPAPTVVEAQEARVSGHVIRGDQRIELDGIAVFREGPTLVLLITNGKVSSEDAPRFAADLLEGSGLVGVKMGLGAPGSELAAEGASPLYVQFLPGDGSMQFSSGGSPGYAFEAETLTPEEVAGRLHGTIVQTPEQVDVDVTFSTPLE